MCNVNEKSEREGGGFGRAEDSIYAIWITIISEPWLHFGPRAFKKKCINIKQLARCYMIQTNTAWGKVCHTFFVT